MFGECRRKIIDCVIRLAVDVETGRRKGFDQFIQGRDRLTATHPRIGHVAPLEFSDFPRAPTGSAEIFVVECDEHTICCSVNIRLEIREAEGNCVSECREGVLWVDTGATAMRKSEHSLPIKIGMLRSRSRDHSSRYSGQRPPSIHP